MESDDRVILLGEDIESPYGGAFKVTKDLSALFPDGCAIPQSARRRWWVSAPAWRWRASVHMRDMFGDSWLWPAIKSLITAAKFRYMYNGKCRSRW